MSRETSRIATAESMAKKQRDISVSEFFLKNRHLLGFDNPRKALLTTVKEAVDNALDACEEAGIVPEISVDIRERGPARFSVAITDNGPGIVRAQIPRIFAKLLYGSKFHRLKMSRGQQGIGISAAGMYGQLTTGSATCILSKTRSAKASHLIEVQIDTRKNQPAILADRQEAWRPEFFPVGEDGAPGTPVSYAHGTRVSIEMEASYVRGRLSVDEYLRQCAMVNPHLQLHYRIVLLKHMKDPSAVAQAEVAGEVAGAGGDGVGGGEGEAPGPAPEGERVLMNRDVPGAPWVTFPRVTRELPPPPGEIKPHPHGVELGILMQMLKDTSARTLRAALCQDFSRVSSPMALQICERAGLNPKARPTRVAHKESEALFKAINETRLMRPPTDCLSPISEEALVAGLKKSVPADFYTAITRSPTVYRGNPFQVEAGLAYARPGSNSDLGAEDPVRVLRFANRVPLLHMAGGCAATKAVSGVNWKSYGLTQPRGAPPLGPMVVILHIVSVWVPFTSESKEAIAHYPEIVKEMTAALQECGRRLSVYLSRRRRQAEAERKRDHMALYIPHLALGLKEVLELSDRQEHGIVDDLTRLLEKTRLEP